MSDDKPNPPFSISESAIALHEFYLGLVVAGFTPEQALYLTAQVISRGQMQ